MANRQELSKNEIMQELDGITADFAFLYKSAESNYNTSFWREERCAKLLELEKRLADLHISICKLPRAIDRAEALATVRVLKRLIML